MQMYVNYFDRFVKTASENPTVGILLCKRKKNAIVELTFRRTPTSLPLNTSFTCLPRKT